MNWLKVTVLCWKDFKYGKIETQAAAPAKTARKAGGRMWGDDTEHRTSDNRGNLRNNTVKTCTHTHTPRHTHTHTHTQTHTQCMPECLKSIRILDCGLVGIQLSSDLHMHRHHTITQVPTHLVSTRAAQTPTHPIAGRPTATTPTSAPWNH